MYSLNINFLNDRPEFQTAKAGKAKAAAGAAVPAGKAPMYLGIVVGIIFPALVGGGLAWLMLQINNLNSNQAKLDESLATLQAEIDRSKKAQDEMKLIDQQTESLASVFDRVRAWSAILSDIRDRLPAGVQIDSIREDKNPALATTGATKPKPSPSPSASPSPGASASPSTAASSAPAPEPAVDPNQPPERILRITGFATSVSGVGQLLLLLKKSPFLNPKFTTLVSSTLIDNPATLGRSDPNRANQEEPQGISYTILNPEEMEKGSGGNSKLPQVVKYEIYAAHTLKPAKDIRRELDRAGASGLVVRLETIQSILGKTPSPLPSQSPDSAAPPGTPAVGIPTPATSDSPSVTRSERFRGSQPSLNKPKTDEPSEPKEPNEPKKRSKRR